jgi:uncharacterized protein with FMN-binding domain
VKRSPIVAVGTVVGLASVLSFHSTPVKLNLAPTASSTTAPATTTPAQSATGATTTKTAPTTTTTAAVTGIHTVTGPLVNYYYGQLSVKVTANGKKITSVTIGTISDGGNPRSVSIDQYAVPILEPEVISAQSSSIQSVSGASYTSAGFQMSLQYALKTLGI